VSGLYIWRREGNSWWESTAGSIYSVRNLGWYLRPAYAERRIRGTTVFLDIGPFTTLAKAKRAAEELAGVPEMQEVLAP